LWKGAVCRRGLCVIDVKAAKASLTTTDLHHTHQPKSFRPPRGPTQSKINLIVAIKRFFKSLPPISRRLSRLLLVVGIAVQGYPHTSTSTMDAELASAEARWWILSYSKFNTERWGVRGGFGGSFFLRCRPPSCKARPHGRRPLRYCSLRRLYAVP
jgi:hypothetical protein